MTRRFGATTALDGVDLTVHRGQSLALFGVNGAGKTTLLRVLSGGLKPTAGTLVIDGHDPRRAPDRARGRIGLLSHHTLLYDDLSALENLVFFAKLHGLARPDERASARLEEVGLTDRAHEPVRGFSRGMQQRVALARALLHEPSLLLLDEPSSGLDANETSALADMLRHVRAERGTAVLLVEHDVEFVRAFVDRLYVLDFGTLIASGPTTEVLGSDEVRRAYLGETPSAV